MIMQLFFSRFSFISNITSSLDSPTKFCLFFFFSSSSLFLPWHSLLAKATPEHRWREKLFFPGSAKNQKEAPNLILLRYCSRRARIRYIEKTIEILPTFIRQGKKNKCRIPFVGDVIWGFCRFSTPRANNTAHHYLVRCSTPAWIMRA